VPIARRSSGGGTVMLGPGCLCFSLVLRFDRDPALSDLHASYRYILGRIGGVLAALASPAGVQGTSDLAVDEHKISGNAQQRKRTHLLHHGTLLYGFDLTLLERYLKPPPRQPDYRRGRRHVDFLTNVPITPTALKQSLRNAWQASTDALAWPSEIVERLVREKYSCTDWVRRR
jgi:lipoate-protein ligase A